MPAHATTLTATALIIIAVQISDAPSIARAGSAVPLADAQLDQVTAGSAVVGSAASAQATGLITIANTASNSLIGSNQSVEDGFGSYGGVTVGTAVAYGSNGGNASSNTSVTTGGAAQGNFVLNMSGGGKATAGPLTIQAGFTSVYGVFVPGL
jgi:hypothetical protein